jgi:hypothetical protein
MEAITHNFKKPPPLLKEAFNLKLLKKFEFFNENKRFFLRVYKLNFGVNLNFEHGAQN